MIEILAPLKRVRIELNPDFYPWSTIEETLKEFEEICEWEIKDAGLKYIVILISKKDLDLERLGYEFMNHLFARLKESVV